MHTPMSFTKPAQHDTARRVIAALYEERNFTQARDYCAATIRHYLLDCAHQVAAAGDVRAYLESQGYRLPEIEMATAHMETFDEVRFAVVDGVELWFGQF